MRVRYNVVKKKKGGGNSAPSDITSLGSVTVEGIIFLFAQRVILRTEAPLREGRCLDLRTPQQGGY